MIIAERSYNDMKSWNSMINTTYFERHKSNPKLIRTYFMRWNGIANKVTPMISNWIEQEPQADWKPYHPRIMQAVVMMQPSQPEFY